VKQLHREVIVNAASVRATTGRSALHGVMEISGALLEQENAASLPLYQEAVVSVYASPSRRLLVHTHCRPAFPISAIRFSVFL